MKHVSWFKLLLRAIGIVLIGLALPKMGGVLVELGVGVYYRLRGDLEDPQTTEQLARAWWSLIWHLGYVLQLGLGLYLLFDARWLVRVCVHDAAMRCPACKYDLTGAAPGVCPECGVKLPSGVYFPDRTLVTTIRSLSEQATSAQSLEQGGSAGAEPGPSAASHPPSDPGR